MNFYLSQSNRIVLRDKQPGVLFWIQELSELCDSVLQKRHFQIVVYSCCPLLLSNVTAGTFRYIQVFLRKQAEFQPGDKYSCDVCLLCFSCTEHLCCLRQFVMRCSTVPITSSPCLICKPAHTRLSRGSSSALVSPLLSVLFWNENLWALTFSWKRSQFSSVIITLSARLLVMHK